MVKKLKVGDKAPNFNLPDVENRNRSLKEFLGQKVVLVFFVGAFTSSCTKELCVFRDSIAQLIDLNAQIVGIDVNVPSANKGLAEKNRLTFPILSDYKREVIEKYGLEVPDFAGPRMDLMHVAGEVAVTRLLNAQSSSSTKTALCVTRGFPIIELLNQVMRK